MADLMIFPKTIQEFIQDYSFKDTQEAYTNGSKLIPVFRMEQAHTYYGQQIKNQTIEEFAEWIFEFTDGYYFSSKEEIIKAFNNTNK